jgi:carbonic anhydrase/acetyltransferase-like protein (isoleucine patch superfamily)
MREQLRRWLDWRARRRLEQMPEVCIDASARIGWRALTVARGSRLAIGPGSVVAGSIVLQRAGAEVSLGRDTSFGTSLIDCAERIEIGDDVQISWQCVITDHDSHALRWSQRRNDVRDQHEGRKNWSDVATAPVKLGDKCWIGMHSLILKGVEIGEGAIVAAGSVVTKSVAPWTIVGGNPARVIRAIPPDER